MYVYYKSTDGTVKDTYGYVDFTKYNFEYNAPLTNNFRLFINKEDTLCWGEVELLTDVSDVLVKVGTQEDLEASSGSYIIVVRKDGTVWTKDFYNYENFTKIFTPTEDDAECHGLSRPVRLINYTLYWDILLLPPVLYKRILYPQYRENLVLLQDCPLARFDFLYPVLHAQFVRRNLQ